MKKIRIWFFIGKLKIFFFLILLDMSFIVKGEIYAGETLRFIATIHGDEVSKPFNQPCGFFYDESRKRIYIADTRNNRLVSYDSQFTFLSEFSAEGKLELPTSLVRDRRGRLIVTESKKNQVTLIDIKNKKYDPLDFSKVPTGDPVVPGNLAIDKKNQLYVVDRANKRILVFNESGKYIRGITIKEGLGGFNDVKVGEDGNIYAIDTLKGRVYIFNQEGKLLRKFGERNKGEGKFDFPVSLAVDRRGLVYVIDRHKNRLLVYNQKGDYIEGYSQIGWKEGRFYYPTYIFIDQSQRIFIIDRDNNRIQVYKR
ncbi:MAG: NHL repeat-containing protein [Spirochaetota bacterium]|nr:NHL repeat-containing protein [Spirochaetota bacterium]